MISEIFSCDGLNKNDCSMRDYCGWCIEPNITNVSFCKQIDSCFENISNTCEVHNKPVSCFIDGLFLCLILIVLYTLSILIITNFIKNILRKILIKSESIDNDFNDFNDLNDLNDFEKKLVSFKDISEDKNLIINDEKTHLINNVENDSMTLLNKKIDTIGHIIGLIIYIVVGTATLILYYTNFFMFLVEMFFIVIFIILLFCFMTYFF